MVFNWRTNRGWFCSKGIYSKQSVVRVTGSVSFEEVENILFAFLQGDFEHIKIALRPNNA
jgi:hypothetical protein